MERLISAGDAGEAGLAGRDLVASDFTADWNVAMKSLIKTLRSILDT